MAVTSATRGVPADAIPHRPNPVLQFLRKEPLGTFGFLIILMYFAFALGARWIAPYDPEAVDFTAMLSPPGGEHFFGTDQYGRDVFSRLVYGARTALGVGILSAWFGCTVGAVLGATSG